MIKPYTGLQFAYSKFNVTKKRLHVGLQPLHNLFLLKVLAQVHQAQAVVAHSNAMSLGSEPWVDPNSQVAWSGAIGSAASGSNAGGRREATSEGKEGALYSRYPTHLTTVHLTLE